MDNSENWLKQLHKELSVPVGVPEGWFTGVEYANANGISIESARRLLVGSGIESMIVLHNGNRLRIYNGDRYAEKENSRVGKKAWKGKSVGTELRRSDRNRSKVKPKKVFKDKRTRITA